MNIINKRMSITRKRLDREIPHLEEKYKKIQVTYEKGNPTNIILYDPIEENLPKTLEIDICKNYPFKPPIIKVDSTNYLTTLPHYEINKYRKLMPYKDLPFQGDCLHCEFITKMDWSAALLLRHVLEQIKKIQETKRMIKEYLMLQIIEKKFRIPPEINQLIHSYL